jgi:drug/metabolite transporter (DMT)-like permease
VPLIPIDMLPSSPMQSATSPAALLEEFGPHALVPDARKLSAKEPVEQAPSVIAEPPVAVAAYALGSICCTPGAATVAAIAATAANATIMVSVEIIFVLIFRVFFIVVVHQMLQEIDCEC